MKGKRAADDICFHCRDTEKCPYGPSFKFKHPPKVKGGGEGGRGYAKKAKLTKADRKQVHSIRNDMKKKAKSQGHKVGDSDLRSYLQSLMFIRTILRHCYEKRDVGILAMATKLLDTKTGACLESGSGADTSFNRRDFMYVDESPEAKGSVSSTRGPSVGSPGCAGIGRLCTAAI